MKKHFTNYNYKFEKNEKKLLVTFCKQALKQMGNENKYFAEVKAFTSILEKLNDGQETVKLTKDEKIRLSEHIKQNMNYIGRQADKSFILKKWLMKSLHKQYVSLYENHFKE